MPNQKPSATATPGLQPTPLKNPLAQTLVLDWTAAICSAASVAPIISIVDKSIFANASGREPLLTCMKNGFVKLVTQPLAFVRQPSFLLIWGVYSGTYIVANSVETLCNRNNTPWFYPKFIASSIANVGLSVLKDLYFTRAFGKTEAPGTPSPTTTNTSTAGKAASSTSTAAATRSVPFRSYSLYTIRDTMTIFASFNLPPLVSSYMSNKWGYSTVTADTIAQLSVPCAVQFLSSPLHLLGMDFYNRPSGLGHVVSVQDRAAFIRREYLGTSLARCARIFPAFGIGGVLNKSIRKNGNHLLEELRERNMPNSSKMTALILPPSTDSKH